MPTQRTERRLSAIMSIDVVGFSRLMGADEEGTLEVLKRLRQDFVAPQVAQHNGRIVKSVLVPQGEPDRGTVAQTFMDVYGVGEDVAQAMVESGLESLEDVNRATDEELLQIQGIGTAKVEKIRKAGD